MKTVTKEYLEKLRAHLIISTPNGLIRTENYIHTQEIIDIIDCLYYYLLTSPVRKDAPVNPETDAC